MLRFELKRMLDDYEARTGIHVSYEELSTACGISIDTLKSLVSRRNYNTTLETISKIAKILDASPLQFLSYSSDQTDDGEK